MDLKKELTTEKEALYSSIDNFKALKVCKAWELACLYHRGWALAEGTIIRECKYISLFIHDMLINVWETQEVKVVQLWA